MAGALARKWGVLPKAWGSVMKATCKVQCSLAGAEAEPKARPQPAALDAVRGYVERE
jgi:hypothetical protein